MNRLQTILVYLVSITALGISGFLLSVLLTESMRLNEEQGNCIAKLISLEVERADIIKVIKTDGTGSCKRRIK